MMPDPDPDPGPDPDEPPGDLELERLLREVGRRVHGVLDEQDRLRALLDAVVTMAGDLTLDGVLHRILTAARALTGARYAALGVLEPGSGRRLDTFIHQGMEDSLARSIGPLPSGKGVLGVITERREPLRLDDIAEHASSFGFPAGHPPMHSFLGVPIRIHDRSFGNLYLTEKAGGLAFTEEDEGVVVALAAAAGVVVENARLYAEAARRERWLAGDAEVAAVLSGHGTGADGLQAIVELVRDVAGADVAWIASGGSPPELVLRAACGDGVDLDDLRSRSLVGSTAARALSTGSAVAVADIESDPGSLVPPQVERALGLQAVAGAPLSHEGQTEGVIAVGWRGGRAASFHDLDPALLTRFADHVTLNLNAARARAAQQRVAVLEDRERIARDLHDLVIQRIFAVEMNLQGARRRADAEVSRSLATAIEDLDATITDLRRSIFGLAHVDVAGDLQGEMTRIVERAAATLKFRPTLRFRGPVRTLVDPDTVPDLLAVLSEALSNVTRHAGAAAVSVELSVGTEVTLTVTDDGRGLPAGSVLGGLANMRARARCRGGDATFVSPPGGGTTVRWVVPVAPVVPLGHGSSDEPA